LLFVGLNFAVMGVAFSYIRLCVRIVGEADVTSDADRQR